MLATNPVQPHQISRLEILGQAGPHEAWPRKHESAPFPVAKFLGLGAGVLAAYVVVGSIAASAPQPVEAPVGKQAPAIVVPAMTPAPGEFRLAPGNNQPPGLVRFEIADPVPGDFRLAPGNNQPPGMVTE
jgi:hypothetical protein